MSKYIIINAEAIQKRIEELKPKNIIQAHEVSILKEILSQSTPLIPEIEKAHNVGRNYGCYLQGGSYDHNDNIDSEDYISNLKLDI